MSLPINNRVIYSGLQLADNGADSSCSCVFLSSLFFPRLCHCTTEEGESGYEEVVLAWNEAARVEETQFLITPSSWLCTSASPQMLTNIFVSCALHPAAMVL